MDDRELDPMDEPWLRRPGNPSSPLARILGEAAGWLVIVLVGLAAAGLLVWLNVWIWGHVFR